MTNLKKYQGDLNRLIDQSQLLFYSLANEFKIKVVINNGKEKRNLNKYLEEMKLSLPDFKSEYEKWYTEALEVIKQVLPSRYEDFRLLYKPDKRREIDFLTYTMSDYMIGLQVKIGGEVKVDGSAAFPKFQQQMKILESAQKRFESSLFVIKHLLQADLFDGEIDTARELLQNGYIRASGAVTGVVLEKHLQQVCSSHNATVKGKNPCINDYGDALKEAQVIEIPTWRFIQRLSDLRNLCDHKKKREPKPEEIEDLINGVDKVSKTVF